MRCSSPRTVGFKADGKTICWSPKQRSKEFAAFQLPCGKCLECRLDYARQWAVRCVHEAQMHEKNCFITLTYSDEHLKSPKLIYSDFQKFMKKLRKLQDAPMGVFVTGEYGDQTKRPHWHAIIFNWKPTDLVYHRSNDRGDQIYKSETLDRIWGKNDPEKRPNEVGEVTFHSAGYVARYAAKKLIHGSDQEHDYHPISKKSSKYAIGKKWVEQYWPDVFNYGELEVNGSTTSIPRYYEKWLKENQPSAFLRYVTEIKQERILRSTALEESRRADEIECNDARRIQAASRNLPFTPVRTAREAKKIIQRQKFQQLQDYLKLK